MKTKASYTISGKKYDISPFSAVFPPMSDEEYADFKKDVESNGFTNTIIYTDPRNGRIVEGRHRVHAAEDIGTDSAMDSLVFMDAPVPLPVTDDGIKAFVLSSNMHRRHLSTSQRAMIASTIANIDYKTTLRNLANLAKGEKTEGVTIKDAAKVMNVSPRAVKQANRVKRHPDLADKVTSGEVTLNAADTEASNREGGKKGKALKKTPPAPSAPEVSKEDELLDILGEDDAAESSSSPWTPATPPRDEQPTPPAKAAQPTPPAKPAEPRVFQSHVIEYINSPSRSVLQLDAIIIEATKARDAKKAELEKAVEASDSDEPDFGDGLLNDVLGDDA